MKISKHPALNLVGKHGNGASTKLIPFEEKRRDIFGYMKGAVSILGDIEAPTGEVWEADA
jgi:hypothetical protein